MSLLGQLTPIVNLTDRQRGEMFALMDRYYCGMSRETFDADLNEKQWVIQLVEPDTQSIRGFSTQMLISLNVDGRRVRGLFSGDTIIDHHYWGSTALTQAWGRMTLDLIDGHDDCELYWFLISKGFRTYRFLPVFFHEFYPRFDLETPRDVVRLIDAFAGDKYPAHYDSASGIIRVGNGNRCRLRDGVGEISTGRQRDPHVQFFSERNPGHVNGDELCCLAPLSRENFTAAAWRMIDVAAMTSVDQ